VICRRQVLACSSFAVLSGCSQPVALYAGNRDVAYRQKLQRVLVTLDFRDPRMIDAQWNVIVRRQEIQQSLAAEWGPLGVSFELLDLDGVSDRAKATADATARFAPTQIALVRTTHWNKAGGMIVSIVDGYMLEVAIYDAATRQIVWQGTVEFKEFTTGGRSRSGPLGTAKSHQNDANDFARALTAQLKADGLL
jgi:hypothetical protein